MKTNLKYVYLDTFGNPLKSFLEILANCVLTDGNSNWNVK
jgi:hypothetical protein